MATQSNSLSPDDLNAKIKEVDQYLHQRHFSKQAQQRLPEIQAELEEAMVQLDDLLLQSTRVERDHTRLVQRISELEAEANQLLQRK